MKKLVFAISICFLNSLAIYSQASINAFQIKSSTLVENLRQKKVENPKISAKELTDFANEIVAKEGFNYRFQLSDANCKTLFEAQNKLKNGKKLSALSGKFPQPQGEPVAVSFPEIIFTDNCGCYVNVPGLNVTESDFVMKIWDQNIKLIRPQNFLNYVELVDNQTFKQILRRWFIPFPSKPIGIYEDGKMLFLEFPNDEFSELAIAIYDSGILQIIARKDWDLSEKATTLKTFPTNANNPNLTFISFGKEDKIKVLKFSLPCN